MVLLAAFEEVECPLNVDLTVGERSYDGWSDPSERCQMHHQVDRLLLEQALQQLVITNIALPAHQTCGSSRCGQQPAYVLLFNGGGIESIEIIQACHPMPLCPQTRAQVRPYKPCPSCY